jgi:hypothetical protein
MFSYDRIMYFRLTDQERPAVSEQNAVCTTPAQQQQQQQQQQELKRNATKPNPSNDDAHCRQGKRKISFSQYKENKRTKSNESIDTSLADIDMRISSNVS